MDNFGIFNNKNGVNFFNNLKGGVKANAFKTETDKKLLSIFDKNHDGILSKAELSQIADDLDNIKKDGKISQKELNNFINANDLGAEGKEALMNFIGTIANEDANIVSSETINGQTVTTYKDGTTEAVNQDGSKTVTQKDSSGNTVVTEMTKDGVPTKKTTTSPDGNKETVVEYNSDGRTVKSETTIDKQAQTKTVKEGTTVTQYDTSSGQDVKSKVIENAGIPGKEKTTTFEKNEDGQQIETTTDGNQTKVIVKDSSGRVIKGSIEDLNKGIRKEVEYTSEGKTETITQDGRTVTNEYNKDGQKIASEINGQKAKYDGQGNTLVVVQNNEPIYTLAQKFGVSMDEIAQANGGRRNFKTGEEIKIPKEVAPGSKGLVGRKSAEEAKAETNAIYKKITDGAKEFDSMNSMKMKSEVSSYKELALELFKQEGNPKPSDIQLQARIKNLQAANPGIKDGDLKGKDLNVKVADNNTALQAETKLANKLKENEENGKSIAHGLESAMAGIGTRKKDFEEAFNQINKDNVADVLIQYRNNSEAKEGFYSAMWGEAEFQTPNVKYYATMLDNLYAKADELGIDYADIKNQLSAQKVTVFSQPSEEYDKLTLQLAERIKMTEEFIAERGSIENEKELMDLTYSQLQTFGTDAARALDNQNKKEGWAGDLASGVGHVTDLFNNKGNYLSNVENDIKLYNAKVDKLGEAKSEAEFKAVFEQEFGCKFDPVLIAKYNNTMVQKEKIVEKQAELDLMEQTFGRFLDVELHLGYNSPPIQDAIEPSYMTDMRNRYGSSKAEGQKIAYLEAYNTIKDYVGEDALKGLTTNGTEEEIKKMKEICDTMRTKAKEDLNNLTGGLSYEEFMGKCDAEAKAAFGTQSDIVGRVKDYCISQDVTAERIKTGIKTYVAVGVTLATMGAGTGVWAASGIEAASDGFTEFVVETSDVVYRGAHSDRNDVTFDEVKENGVKAIKTSLTEFAGSAGTVGITKAISKIPGVNNAIGTSVTVEAKAARKIAAPKIAKQFGKKIVTNTTDEIGSTAMGVIAFGDNIDLKENAINIGVGMVTGNSAAKKTINGTIKGYNAEGQVTDSTDPQDKYATKKLQFTDSGSNDIIENIDPDM